MRNDTTDVQLAQANWNDDRFMTLLDYEVGFAWTGPQRRWRFATGYTASFWYNAVTTPEFIGAVQTSNYTDVVRHDLVRRPHRPHRADVVAVAEFLRDSRSRDSIHRTRSNPLGAMTS